jgi:hypothetical protein
MYIFVYICMYIYMYMDGELKVCVYIFVYTYMYMYGVDIISPAGSKGNTFKAREEHTEQSNRGVYIYICLCIYIWMGLIRLVLYGLRVMRAKEEPKDFFHSLLGVKTFWRQIILHVDRKIHQKMLFIMNALDQGWKIKKNKGRGCKWIPWCIYVYLFICINTYMHTYICSYMCIYMYVYIYKYIYI